MIHISIKNIGHKDGWQPVVSNNYGLVLLQNIFGS
jgi:hypothetical protein